MIELTPDEFFERVGGPETWRPIGGVPDCGGVIGPTTTREDLIARGFTSMAADEALRYYDRLRLRGRPATTCPFCVRDFDTTEEWPTHKCP